MIVVSHKSDAYCITNDKERLTQWLLLTLIVTELPKLMAL